MMSVHVAPGLSAPSAVSDGAFALVGLVWGDLLGRASVAALSFVSGWLLWTMLRRAPVLDIALARAGTILVPMLVWNLVFLVGFGVRHLLVAGSLPGPGLFFFVDESALASLTGLDGPTANQSLFFLRDLFAATVIVALLRPLIGAYPILLLGALVVLAVFRLTEPLVFRPMVLVFVAAGAAAAARGVTLWSLGRPGVALPVAAALGLVALIFAGRDAVGPAVEALDLIRRVALSLLAFAAARALTGSSAGRLLIRAEPAAFLTYLSHVPLIGVLWFLTAPLIGGATGPLYLAFFVAAPFAAFGFGLALRAALARAAPGLRAVFGARAGARAPVRVPVSGSGA